MQLSGVADPTHPPNLKPQIFRPLLAGTFSRPEGRSRATRCPKKNKQRKSPGKKKISLCSRCVLILFAPPSPRAYEILSHGKVKHSHPRLQIPGVGLTSRITIPRPAPHSHASPPPPCHLTPLPPAPAQQEVDDCLGEAALKFSHGESRGYRRRPATQTPQAATEARNMLLRRDIDLKAQVTAKA